MEQVEALDEKVVSRLENYGLVAHGNWGSHPVFRIPVWQLWQKKASRRQRAEYERAEEKATQMEGRCYAEIQALIDQSATVARQCEHAQWFAAAGTLRLSSEARGDSRLPIRRYTGYIYAIVGEREQAPHTAAESP
jgi:hypothetical protein